MKNRAFCLMCGKALEQGPMLSEIFAWRTGESDMIGFYSCPDHPHSSALSLCDFKKVKPKKEGKYFYMHPKFAHPIIVNIVENKNKLYIDFNDNEEDMLLKECDKRVLWYKIGK